MPSSIVDKTRDVCVKRSSIEGRLLRACETILPVEEITKRGCKTIFSSEESLLRVCRKVSAPANILTHLFLYVKDDFTQNFLASTQKFFECLGFLVDSGEESGNNEIIMLAPFIKTINWL